MAGFDLHGFRGLRPRAHPRLLDTSEAQIANKVKIGSGAIESFHSFGQEADLSPSSSIKAIYKYRIPSPDPGNPHLWLRWQQINVDVCSSPVEDDEFNRVYYTGATGGNTRPKMTTQDLAYEAAQTEFPNDYYHLGVPAPADAPTVTPPTIEDNGTVDATDMSDTAFTMRWADDSYDYHDITNATGWNTTNVIVSTYPGAASHHIDLNWSVGMEFFVTIVDSDNFTIEDANGGSYISEALDLSSLDDGHGGPDGLERLYNTASESGLSYYVQGYVRVRNGINVELTDHGLLPGDKIRVTAIDEPLTFNIKGFGNFTVAQNNVHVVNCTGATFTPTAGRWKFEVLRGVSEDEDAAVIEDRSYVYTYVSVLGEEGPPSPPSDPQRCVLGSAVTISGFSAPTTDHRDIPTIRIYRTSSGSETTEFQFVAEIDDPFDPYDDLFDPDELGEVIQTETWDPPSQTMRGLVSMPGGYLAGFFGNTIAFSEPGFPHAWPTDYRYTVDFTIIGLGVFGSTLAILTDGVPYIASGAHPRNMQPVRVLGAHPCVSKQGIVSMPTGVVYPSVSGLCRLGLDGASVISQQYFSRDDWQSLNPETFVAASWNGRYMALYVPDGGDNSTRTLLIYHMEDPDVGVTLWDNVSCAGVWNDVEEDKLYVISTGSVIFEFDRSDAAMTTVTWRSKPLIAPYPMNPGVARVVADAYPVTFKLYSGATPTLRHTQTVTSSSPFRLPGGYLADTFTVEVSGQGIAVSRIQVGETMDEVLEG